MKKNKNNKKTKHTAKNPAKYGVFAS